MKLFYQNLIYPCERNTERLTASVFPWTFVSGLSWWHLHTDLLLPVGKQSWTKSELSFLPVFKARLTVLAWLDCPIPNIVLKSPHLEYSRPILSFSESSWLTTCLYSPLQPFRILVLFHLAHSQFFPLLVTLLLWIYNFLCFFSFFFFW